MDFEEQQALLSMWQEFLADRRPNGRLMRAFYVEVIRYSRYYRYGMAAELFDLLTNGAFRPEQTALWSTARNIAQDDRAA